MNPEKKPIFLKRVTLCAAALGCSLRAAHCAFGTDGRGLLVRNHWSVLCLWVLCIAFAAMLLVLGSGITARKASTPQKSSLLEAAGCFALGAVLLATGLQRFGSVQLSADFFIWVLGLCAGAGMLIAACFRLLGKKPYFLMHALLCLYITLRTVSMYRLWSSNPQLQDYGFYLTAHAAAMLTAYHHAAFDADFGSHRALWVCSLATVFLGSAALPHSEDGLLLAALVLWAFCGLTVLPVRKRRIRPTVQVKEE